MASSKKLNKPKSQSFVKLVLSALAAAFGVQSRKNLEDDFAQRSPLPFIVAGIVFTAAFVLTLVLVVRLVLAAPT